MADIKEKDKVNTGEGDKSKDLPAETENIREKVEKLNIFKRLKKKIRVPYYYVPPCPACGSERTGRFVAYRRNTIDEYTEKMSLKNGELIQFTAKVEPDKNFFCADCGTTWSEYAPMKWLTLEEIDAEKKKRSTNDEYTAVVAEEKEEKKHRKGGPVFRMFADFVGKF